MEYPDRSYLVEPELKKIVKNLGKISPLLVEAIEYSLMSDGKRFRPTLHLLTGEALGLRNEVLLPTACAIELVHTYSLIHDDLPALDNDMLRRGKPTCHIVFGEDTAIMVGAALFAEAFYVVLNNTYLDPKILAGIAKELAYITGERGMVGGQMLDLRLSPEMVDEEIFMKINENKTAKLIAFSIKSAGMSAGLDEKFLDDLYEYGIALGNAFQIMDDILDIMGEQSAVGKDIGSDKRNNKITIASFLGVAKAKDLAKSILERSEILLDKHGYDFSQLKQTGKFVIERKS